MQENKLVYKNFFCALTKSFTKLTKLTHVGVTKGLNSRLYVKTTRDAQHVSLIYKSSNNFKYPSRAEKGFRQQHLVKCFVINLNQRQKYKQLEK
jgi:hypothetical protein